VSHGRQLGCLRCNTVAFYKCKRDAASKALGFKTVRQLFKCWRFSAVHFLFTYGGSSKFDKAPGWNSSSEAGSWANGSFLCILDVCLMMTLTHPSVYTDPTGFICIHVFTLVVYITLACSTYTIFDGSTHSDRKSNPSNRNFWHVENKSSPWAQVTCSFAPSFFRFTTYKSYYGWIQLHTTFSCMPVKLVK
jgi:hypothetical protein